MIVPGSQMNPNNAPSYSPYNNNPANYKQLGPEDSKNILWRKWGHPGVVLGCILLLLGLAMIPIEIIRILKGSLNKGENGSYFLYPNYNLDKVYSIRLFELQLRQFLPDVYSTTKNNTRYRLDQKGIIPYSALSSVAGVSNYPIQDKYLWPWSHAVLLFAIVTITAGGLGILSGTRRTYSSAFAFFVLSLLSALLSIFLIAYYAIEVYWQLNQNANRRLNNEYSKLDYSLASTMLALSCANCLLSFITTIFVGLALALCCGPKADLTPRTVAKVVPRNQFIRIKPPPQFIPVPVPIGAIPRAY